MLNQPPINETITLSVVSVQEVFVSLNDYLNYLIEEHKKYKITFNRKEDYDKAVLEAKITSLTHRVYSLKAQLDRRANVINSSNS